MRGFASPLYRARHSPGRRLVAALLGFLGSLTSPLAAAPDPRPRIEVRTVLHNDIVDAAGQTNDPVQDDRVQRAVSRAYVQALETQWAFVTWGLPGAVPAPAGRITLHVAWVPVEPLGICD